jgi:Spy/CpxP family protein refolding chaperone
VLSEVDRERDGQFAFAPSPSVGPRDDSARSRSPARVTFSLRGATSSNEAILGTKTMNNGRSKIAALGADAFQDEEYFFSKIALPLIVAAVIVLLHSSAMAQQPYAGLQNRPIKTLSDQQIADLNAGRGMGLALAAELNGYPGPIHAIELAEQLHLSPDQVSKLKSLFEAMKAETIPLGAMLISQERDLNDDFANRRITLASLEVATKRIGATQAALRAAHLEYHLSTVAVLTAEQVAQYNELRGYKADGGTTHNRRQHQ